MAPGPSKRSRKPYRSLWVADASRYEQPTGGPESPGETIDEAATALCQSLEVPVNPAAAVGEQCQSVDRPTGFKHGKKGHCPRTFPVAGLGDSDTVFELTHSPSIQCWAVVVIKDPLSHGGQRACVFSRGASYLR